MYLNLFIARRYLFSKQKEVFISIINTFSIIGIALGVATLIIVMAVMNGYEKELISKILGLKGHLTIMSNEGLIEDYKQIVKDIKANPEIFPILKQINPVFEGQAMIMSKGGFSGIIVKGMELENLREKDILKDSIILGELDDDGLLVGISLAEDLKVKIGSSIKLIIPQGRSTIIGTLPRMKTYKTSGIFDVGMYEYNRGIVFMPLPLAQTLYEIEDRVSHLEIFAKDITYISELTERLLKILPSKYKLIDWRLNNQTLVQALRIERNVMFLILSLIIIIAAFNIISGLMILVKDKSKSIAIMRTIGFSKRRIIKIFCLYGFSIGFLGTMIGTALGIAFTLNINRIKTLIEHLSGSMLFDPVVYFLTSLPAHLDWLEVGQIIFIALLFSLLATIYPARKIAKLEPAQVLKYE